jgi:hypothetical protein
VVVAIVGSTVGVAVLLGAGAASSTTHPAPSPSPPVVRSAPKGKMPARPAQPILGVIPTITERGQRIAMPLDPVTSSMQDLKTFDTAAALKARDCMWSLGYRAWTVNTVISADADTYQEFDPIDYLDPATVARSGYPQTLIHRAMVPSANGARAAVPTSAELHAFLGSGTTAAMANVPRGGCQDDGDRAVEGAVSSLPVNPRMLAVQAKNFAMGDDRMQHAITTWSRCMAGRGLHYSDPISAQNDPRWGLRVATTPASTLERQVAVADAGCEKSINFVGLDRALEIGYEKELLAANRAKLTTAKSIADKWVANAKAVIAKE